MALYKLPETLALINRIDNLIRRRATGTPDDIAEKLGVSRSTWYNYLELLTGELNFPIEYDTENQTYFYTANGEFRAGFVIEPDDSPLPPSDTAP